LLKKSPEKSNTFCFFVFVLRKVLKSQTLFDFLFFCEKKCNFRAVRLPARGALRISGVSFLWATPRLFSRGASFLAFTCAASEIGGMLFRTQD
jgi:hypothetical protein